MSLGLQCPAVSPSHGHKGSSHPVNPRSHLHSLAQMKGTYKGLQVLEGPEFRHQ